MSTLLNKVKQLELRKEYTSQDGSFDFVEYQVLDDLRKDILKRVEREPTLVVTLQERTWVRTIEDEEVDVYKIFVHVIDGEQKDCVFVGTESDDVRAINRELWDWVIRGES